jgi:hypothetical protein
VQNTQGARAFLIDYNADNNLASFRYRHRNLRIQAAERAFQADGRDYRAGSFIVTAQGNPSNLASLLDAAGKEFGFFAYGTAAAPTVQTHDVAAPRVAIMHTWTTTQTEGWLRIGFDEYGIPYDYISVHGCATTRGCATNTTSSCSARPARTRSACSRDDRGHARFRGRRRPSRRTSASPSPPMTCAAASSCRASSTSTTS